MNKTFKKISVCAVKVIASAAVVILLWWLFAAVADNDLVLPEPFEVLKIAGRLLLNGQTYLALALTLARAVVAFALSFGAAVVLTLWVGVYPVVKPFVGGLVTVLRAIPTISVILVLMVVFSDSSVVPVAVAFLVTFPVVYGAFLRETEDKQLCDLCKIYNVPAGKRVRYVLFPQISKAMIWQCHDGLPLCIKVVIAGEVLALPRLGLGKQMYVAKVNLLTANVLALTLLALLICLFLSGIFALIERRTAK
ncbi:MAG: hypothetical protein NC132_03730 [Corallococcus sp.]|nr:hypothetical protein [Corallococcus sp.]MCM1359610.1 hypothetical protein [Corallococcus sp.]MCM1395202.1 hypothetical protein [Corallococcus sp.]